MAGYDKIILVTRDDTSVGPMAAAIFKNIVAQLSCPVMSRGLVVLFSEPVNPKANDVLVNNNITQLKDVSIQLEHEDLTENTLLLTFNQEDKLTLVSDFGKDINPENVHTINEFVDELGEIEDPYGADLVGYERCYFELVRLVKKLVYKLG